MRLSQVKADLRIRGIAITRNSDTGEYRVSVNSKAGGEATAYYTNDLVDAYLTGIQMGNAHKYWETEVSE